MLRLLLVRHAQSANKGRAPNEKASPDPGLTQLGELQAQALGERLELEFRNTSNSVKVVCSPMRRCLLTILPAIQRLHFAVENCFCHGGWYEYGCAGLQHAGSTAAEIVAEFPQFKPVGFNATGRWDYRGQNAKENESECRARVERLAHWLQSEGHNLCGMSADCMSGTVILVTHQTVADLLCQVLIDGTSARWAYGEIKYKMQNTGITEVNLFADGSAQFGLCTNEGSHVRALRQQFMQPSAPFWR